MLKVTKKKDYTQFITGIGVEDQVIGLLGDPIHYLKIKRTKRTKKGQKERVTVKKGRAGNLTNLTGYRQKGRAEKLTDLTGYC
ncbi:hypothetical protein ES705_19118 [subsurface metagenome]